MSEHHQGPVVPVDDPSDAELISAVRTGDVDAYGALFERHVEAARRLARQIVPPADVDDLVSEAFAKVLVVLQRGGGPDLAFRAYLLTSVRRLHVDRIRGGSRVQTTDDLTPYDQGVPFEDTAVAGFENAVAARAFASLPERWQQVLWHTEVEGQKPGEIAPLLGMTPNSVSALAYRAREGLRQAFVSMHAQDVVDDHCSTTRANLGAFLRGGLSRRDAARVEAHLEECRSCTAIYLELSEVNDDLGAVLAPILLGSAGAAYLSATHAGALATKGGLVLLLGRGRDWLLHTPAGWAVGGVAAASVVASSVFAGVALTGGAPETPVAAAPLTQDSGPPAPGGSGGSSPAVPDATDRTPTAPARGSSTPSSGSNDDAGPSGGDATGTEDVAGGGSTGTQDAADTGGSGETGGSGGGSGGGGGGTADGAPTIGEPLGPISLAPGAASVTFDATKGASDPDGDVIRVTSARVLGGSAHGTVRTGRAIAGTTARVLPMARAQVRRTVTYTPDPSWRGTETIVYELGDGHGGQVTGTVEVTTPDRAPVARPDSVHAHAGTEQVTVEVLANDSDANHDPLTVTSVGAVDGPFGGTAAVSADRRHVTYRPGPAEVALGTATFRYTVSDGHGGTATAPVSITYGNTVPVAVDDSATTPSTGSRMVVVDVLANDHDADGDALSVTGFGGAEHGTVSSTDGDDLLYVPDPSYDGPDSFTYTTTDSHGGVATGTVRITVAPLHGELALTGEHIDYVLYQHFKVSLGSLPAGRSARVTLRLTGARGWAPFENHTGCDAPEDPEGTVTVVCTVTGPEVLHWDVVMDAGWTFDASVSPVDFVDETTGDDSWSTGDAGPS